MDPLVNLLVMLRLPFVAALVFSTLIRESRPLTLNELAEATGYARSHVYSALRFLEERHLIERIRIRDKKHLFRARAKGVIALVREHLSEIHMYLRSVADELKNEYVLNAMRILEEDLHSLLTKLQEV